MLFNKGPVVLLLTLLWHIMGSAGLRTIGFRFYPGLTA